jgi:hypothetical protein
LLQSLLAGHQFFEAKLYHRSPLGSPICRSSETLDNILLYHNVNLPQCRKACIKRT